ncbi:MAG: hypothetical protein IJT72_07245 [Lachnospiraceae bacterium]|nr:hypothetical protein [Lachnospiraceae bacterium]
MTTTSHAKSIGTDTYEIVPEVLYTNHDFIVDE